MERIIRQLHEGGYSCVVRSGTAVRTFTRRGVADLYDLLGSDSAFLRGASVADRVIGKAAAALLVAGGVREAYADVIGAGALALLRRSPVAIGYGEKVPYIADRTRTGWCPLEARCRTAVTVAECLSRIEDFLHVAYGGPAAAKYAENE